MKTNKNKTAYDLVFCRHSILIDKTKKQSPRPFCGCSRRHYVPRRQRVVNILAGAILALLQAGNGVNEPLVNVNTWHLRDVFQDALRPLIDDAANTVGRGEFFEAFLLCGFTLTYKRMEGWNETTLLVPKSLLTRFMQLSSCPRFLENVNLGCLEDPVCLPYE